MKISELLSTFEDVLINFSTPLPFFSSEEGVKIMLPSPNSAKTGTIFIGSLSDWEEVSKHHMVHDNCTYLICCRNETPEINPFYRDINQIFLDAPFRVVQQRLTSLFNDKQFHNHSDINQMYRSFWKDVISQNITPQQIKERTHHFPYPLHQHLACIVIMHTQPLSKNAHINKITQELQLFFPNQNLFFTGEEWIILYSQAKDTSDALEFDYDTFSLLLEKHQLDAGISYACQLPEAFRTLYMTASVSIELGKKLSVTPFHKRIYTYHQYNPYYAIHLCAHKFTDLHSTDNLIYLTHPDITRIYYYDRENNTNLLDILSAYLACNQNIAQTSQALFMHRNTVLNKLKKINEILKHEFDYDKDHFLLQLSCMIMDYQHNYIHRNIIEFFESPKQEK